MTTSADTLTALREAYKTRKASAIVSAALGRLPRGARLTFGSNFRTGKPEWHLQILCCGSPVDTRLDYHGGLAVLAEAIDTARVHAIEAHGFDPDRRANAQPAAIRVARCEECHKTLTGFDMTASPVTHLCFNCA